MARRTDATPSFVALSFALLLLYLTTGGTIRLVQGQQKTWCVAKPSSDNVALQGNLNFACSQADCSLLLKGQPCFFPDNLMSHASIAMNLYYQTRGRNYWNCNFNGSALIATTDPSYGGCSYAFY